VCVCVCVCVLQALSHVVMYLVLAPFDNEQSDLVHRVNQDVVLEELPVYRCVDDISILFTSTD